MENNQSYVPVGSAFSGEKGFIIERAAEEGCYKYQISHGELVKEFTSESICPKGISEIEDLLMKTLGQGEEVEIMWGAGEKIRQRMQLLTDEQQEDVKSKLLEIMTEDLAQDAANAVLLANEPSRLGREMRHLQYLADHIAGILDNHPKAIEDAYWEWTRAYREVTGVDPRPRQTIDLEGEEPILEEEF